MISFEFLSIKLIILLSIAIIFINDFLYINSVNGVVVDGKRKGPSAMKDQSDKDEMIDDYNTKYCGIYDTDKNSKDNVNIAKEGQFPWLVSFQMIKQDRSREHFCMGSFISDKWILSAAHCFADPKLKPFLDNDDIIVTAGTTKAHGGDNKNFTIKKIYYHSKFDVSSQVGFDVALIEVDEKAEIRTKYENKLPYINTVCLPIEGKSYKTGEAVKLAGWGDTDSKDSHSKSEKLLTTDLKLTDGDKCADIFSKKLKIVKDQYNRYKDFICAGYHGNRDACQGDSGASLLEYADDRAVAIGIVSYGLGCATKGVPGLYEKISSLIPWIKDITKNRENSSVQFNTLEPTKKKK